METYPPQYFFVGIDLGSQGHQVCLLDQAGVIVDTWHVPYTGQALGKLADRLAGLVAADPSRIAVALETPHGPVVETLMDRGLSLYSINPKQVDRFRDRYSPSGAKDDRRDARVLASALRTDRQAFRALEAEDAQVIELRELSRSSAELGEELVRQANRLWSQVHRYYPQLLAFCPAMNEPWAWELLKLAPTPAHGRQLREQRLERLLSRHRIRRMSAAELREGLRQPAPLVAKGVTEAVAARALLLVAQLQLLHQQRTATLAAMERVLASWEDGAAEGAQIREHRDVDIIRSMPGVGITIAATMLAEAPRALLDRDYHRLRVLAGVAPVTRASGTRSQVVMRHACNLRLGNAMYHMGRIAAQFDPNARSYYLELRGRGHGHARAVRSVADRQLRTLSAMLRDGTIYDVGRHGAVQPEIPLAA